MLTAGQSSPTPRLARDGISGRDQELLRLRLVDVSRERRERRVPVGLHALLRDDEGFLDTSFPRSWRALHE